MSTCMLAYPDRVIPTTTYIPQLTGGSWTTGMPLNNLKDPSLGTFARSVDDSNASTIIEIDLRVTRELQVFAIPNHNFSKLATIRVYTCTDALFGLNINGSSNYESVWPRWYPVGSLPNTHESYADGKLTDEAMVGVNAGWWYSFSNPVKARYVKFEILDSANPDGYVQLNRVFCGPAWTPSINMSYGTFPTWMANTIETKSLSGVSSFDRQAPARTHQMVFEAIGINETLVYPFEIQRILGIDGELFFIYDPADVYLLPRQRSFLATLRQMTPIQYPYYGETTVAIELVEKL